MHPVTTSKQLRSERVYCNLCSTNVHSTHDTLRIITTNHSPAATSYLFFPHLSKSSGFFPKPEVVHCRHTLSEASPTSSEGVTHKCMLVLITLSLHRTTKKETAPFQPTLLPSRSLSLLKAQLCSKFSCALQTQGSCKLYVHA